MFLSLFYRTHSPYLAKCTFYSIGAYVGPTYYGWSLERTGDWSVGLTHMGIATVIFGLLLIFGFKRKYTDTSTDIKRIHLIEAIRTVGFNKVVWLGVLIQILNIIPYWGFASMGPYLFMTYKGFSPTEAGSFFGAIYGIGGLSGVVLGFSPTASAASRPSSACPDSTHSARS